MDNFIVSARKYRPSDFHSVVGQHNITSTLKNAISTNKLAQAFLFCGPRGVGKTTCARILAKTINCEHKTQDTEACNKCESCDSFNSNQSLNVFELDAASNNSVEDIRSLVDQVRIPPQHGNFKVYIIDEVHMLSNAAFNAFLKTLEEPPAYAIFILATTEKHKIIPTILSRCQIFDFNRIKVADIANHLTYVAEAEKITAEKDGLTVIAQKADGALRDALSMFDQIVSFSGNGTVTYQGTIDNLNVLDYDYYFKLIDFVKAGAIPDTLLLFNEILNKGFDAHHFISGLGEHFRNLLVCQDTSTIELLEVGDNIKQKYLKQSQACSQIFLLKALGVTNLCDIQYKQSKNARLHVELALLRLCAMNPAALADQKKKPDSELIKLAEQESIEQSTPLIAKLEKTEIPVSSLLDGKNEEETVAETEIIQTSPSIAIKSDEKVNSRARKSSGLSISSFLNKKEDEVAEKAEIYDYPHHPFAETELKKVWLIYADKIKLKGEINLYTTLTNSEIEINNTSIVLPIDNIVQKGIIEEEKTELLSYVRKELKNYSITLETRILEDTNPQKKLYTTFDKFNRLAEKNPNLLILKEKLNLEIDN